MSSHGFNSSAAQKEHAIVHFFAVLAGVEDICALSRLIVSGIGGFVGMNAVVLGIFGSNHDGWLQQWRTGCTSDTEPFTGDERELQAAVTRVIGETGLPCTRILDIVHQGRILGFIGLARRDSGPLTTETEFLISSLQTLTALLLANHRAFVELRHQSTELQTALASLHRRNRTLDGINTIFRETINCKTEEDLGQTCLNVAVELTGSKFAFVGEIGPDGLLHDITISDPGWALCEMYDKTGHRRPPGNFQLRGLLGRVLKDGRPVLANAPSEHPDSIGTPEGHPVLTAFLGVPLIDTGRTVGMIAVGNRERGYGQEELESLELLAPAIVEALRRRRTEQALIHSEKLASVGRLAATIAHEINNPLSGATNALYLVSQDASLSKQGRSWLATAEQELRRAAQIARRILGFYREPNSRSSVMLAPLVEELASVYIPRLLQRNIQVHLRCDKSAFALGNSGELRQLISNLLANSMDAVLDGGRVHLRVGKVTTVNGPPTVCMTVADNGMGIDSLNLNKVFEPFFTTKKDVGTGLGLWISAEIVRKHGGSIRLRSRVGRGTVFRITLPAHARKAAAAPAD